ncbi:MAG: extensin family protein [Pseudomonadota bacterium]
MILRGALVLALLAGSAQADAPSTSLRPVERTGTQSTAPQEDVRQTRPGLLSSLRPLFRSRKATREARAAQQLREKGAICGDIALQGDVVGRVAGTLPGCGVENAVRVRSVAGVALSTGAVMDCQTANALKRWMETSAKPALARRGGGLKSIKVAAHYACRRRNNARTGRISEHGKGRAIDISAFRLQDGSEVTVLRGWNARGTSRALRAMHKGACGPFGTVLGPEANRFHRDHFHFDTARYRSGSFCR